MSILSCVLLAALGPASLSLTALFPDPAAAPLGAVPLGAVPLAVGDAEQGSTARLMPQWTAALGRARQASIVSLHEAGAQVLVADARGGVSAFALSDGALAWFIDLGGLLEYASAPSAGQVVLSVGDRVIVTDATRGGRLFVQQQRSPLAQAGVSDGERVYLPLLSDDVIVAVDMATGLERWTLRLPAPLTAPLLRIPGGTLVLSLADGSVRGFKPEDRTARQTWIRREGRAIGTPTVEGNRVYLATSERSVSCLDGASGRPLWTHRVDARPRSTPVRAGDLWLVATEAGLTALRGCPEGSAQGCAPQAVWRLPSSGMPLGGAAGLALVRGADGRTETYGLEDGAARPVAAPADVPDWRPLGPQRVGALQGDRLRVWSLTR